MAVNLGKKFEYVIREALERVPGVSLDRLNDNTAGFKGVAGICDFIVYKYPYQYYIECKSVHGNTLSIHSNPKPDKNGVLHGFYGNISDTQWEGLLEKSKVPGVIAGVICWWVDKDVTKFIPIQLLEAEKRIGSKSIRYDYGFAHYNKTTGKISPTVTVQGKKKRVFFDYDMSQFFADSGGKK